MKLLIYLTFLFFSLGQLGRISFFNQEINFYFYEPFVAVTLIYFLITYGFTPLKRVFAKYKIIFFFMSSLLVSYLIAFFSFNLVQNTVSLLYFIRLAVYLLYFCYLYYHLKKNKFSIKKETIFLFTLILIASFIQYFFYPDLENLIYLGWDPHYHRMFGVFFDTSTAAAVFGLSLFSAVIQSNLILGVLFLISLVLTFSRSSYISLFISLFYFYITKKAFKLGIAFVAIFIILLVLVPKQFGQGVGLTRTFSIVSRMSDYQQGIQIWLKHPFFGVGYNRIRYIKEQLHLVDETGISSHSAASLSSSYLMILICGGVAGFILFLASLLKLMSLNRETAVLILFIALLSLFDNILLHPFILFLLGSLLVNINLSGKSQ